jgi:HD-like signal output (HDOD) protein
MIPATSDHTQISNSETGRKLCKLPPFHAAAVQVLALSTEDDDALGRLERIFGSDPAMAAELLTAANSAEFGLRGRISTVRHALSLLGIGRTKSLAVTIAMAGYLRTNLARETVRPLWAHGIATAVIAEHLATQIGGSGSLLYTAGLIHDVGRLGLYASSRKTYEPLVGLEFRSIDEVNYMERKLLGVTHCEAGGFLTQTWGFPAILSECARHHHAPLEVAVEAVHIVQEACLLADSMGFSELHIQTDTAGENGVRSSWENDPLFEKVQRCMQEFA